jgi:hypothetical protein
MSHRVTQTRVGAPSRSFGRWILRCDATCVGSVCVYVRKSRWTLTVHPLRCVALLLRLSGNGTSRGSNGSRSPWPRGSAGSYSRAQGCIVGRHLVDSDLCDEQSWHASHRPGRDADVAFLVSDGQGRPVEHQHFGPFGADGRSLSLPHQFFDAYRNWLVWRATSADSSRLTWHDRWGARFF